MIPTTLAKSSPDYRSSNRPRKRCDRPNAKHEILSISRNYFGLWVEHFWHYEFFHHTSACEEDNSAKDAAHEETKYCTGARFHTIGRT